MVQVSTVPSRLSTAGEWSNRRNGKLYSLFCRCASAILKFTQDTAFDMMLLFGNREYDRISSLLLTLILRLCSSLKAYYEAACNSHLIPALSSLVSTLLGDNTNNAVESNFSQFIKRGNFISSICAFWKFSVISNETKGALFSDL